MDMDQELTPFILFTEKDVKPETPHLKLSIALGRELTADSRCYIQATIQRSDSDSSNSPCILSWDQNDLFAAVLLFQHTPNGLRKLEIPHQKDQAMSQNLQTPFIVDGWDASLRQVPPGGSERFMATMPKNVRELLKAGEKYELVWPGGEIQLWDWGTKKEFVGRELSTKEQKICLPASKVTLEFGKFGQVGKEKKERGSPPPIGEAERTPGAPKMTVTLDCNKGIPLTGGGIVKTNVLYEAPSGSPAITFHSFPFQSWYSPREGYRLYRLHQNTSGDTWETISDSTDGFMIVDEPDVSVHVIRDENFASLQPGQMWSTSHRLEGQGVGILPDDVQVGDVFRYVFKGVEVDWWDWGGSEEHVETIVKLPCFLKGRVVEPNDNGGRMKLVVPGSNVVEFKIV